MKDRGSQQVEGQLHLIPFGQEAESHNGQIPQRSAGGDSGDGSASALSVRTGTGALCFCV